MDDIYVLQAVGDSAILKILDFSASHFKQIDPCEKPMHLREKKILFVVEADRFGNSPALYSFLDQMDTTGFSSSVGGLIIAGTSDLYSKTLATKIAFDTNCMGLAFVGRPLVESTKSRKNFRNILSEAVSHESAFLGECEKLTARLQAHKAEEAKNGKILALHASNRNSNTLMLWNRIKTHMQGKEVQEISIENGELHDCRGCSFKVCTHYGEQQSCFYGGVITDEVFPAIVDAEKIILLCPNYNDAISANMSALINRLTALYRTQNFFDKKIFSIIVSGYSGSDALAKQLIGALNMNKSFFLPAGFAMMEIANDRGEILEVDGIEERAKAFAAKITGE